MLMARKDVKPAERSVTWGLSADGKVQRSVGSANNLQTVEIAEGIKFDSVIAVGSEVWAGGEHGALYHSLDGGVTWTQVTIASGDKTLNDQISAIEFTAPQHVIVVTASGSQWVSDDDGQHWKLQP